MTPQGEDKAAVVILITAILVITLVSLTIYAVVDVLSDIIWLRMILFLQNDKQHTEMCKIMMQLTHEHNRITAISVQTILS